MIDIYKNSIIVLSNQSNLVLELNNILQYKDNCDNDECSKTIKTLISDLNNNFKLMGAGKYEKKDKFFYRYLNYPVPRDCYSNITCWETSCLTVPKYQLFCDYPDQFKEKLNQLSKNISHSKNNYVSKIECAEMEINVLNKTCLFRAEQKVIEGKVFALIPPTQKKSFSKHQFPIEMKYANGVCQ